MADRLSVAIVGGTHGNEFSGIRLVQQWQQRHWPYANLAIQTLYANPQANAANRRYLDADLNREFVEARLSDPSLVHYEGQRAKAINQQLGPKGDSSTDLVIDLHNTTSNMGPTLILLQDGDWERQLAAFVTIKMPTAVVLMELERSYQQWGYLCTVGKRGVMVEVGPQPQSVLRHDILEQMAELTELVLAFTSLEYAGALPELPTTVEVFSSVEHHRLPLDSTGQPLAMVHQRVEGSDFTALNPGEPIFQYFDGNVACFDSPRALYPTFVNEAAYYDNHMAFSLADKLTLTVPRQA
ncbi:aspartoacylase [Ferrimonas senticii]|uniref:aspartoacylase n=1 Tax=Ferrimonas senticii TaxID=394566 RepID=UPI0004102987|nr:aspartoacylase [Ferrimonas senticii]